MKWLFCFYIVMGCLSVKAQTFSIDREKAFKDKLSEILKNPTPESRLVKDLLEKGDLNLASSILAEGIFKLMVTTYKIERFLPKKELLIHKQIHFRVDTTTSYFPTRSVSSRWVNGVPYIEYYPDWVFGFFDYMLAYQVISDKRLKRSRSGVVLRAISFITNNHSLYEELALDSTDEEILQTESFFTSSSLSLAYNFLFIYLHELAHLSNQDFNEYDADKFATEIFIKILEEDYSSVSVKSNEYTNKQLNVDYPVEFNNFSILVLAAEHFEFLMDLLIYSSSDYSNVIKEYCARQKNIFSTFSDKLNCRNWEKNNDSLCKGLVSYVDKNAATILRMNESLSQYRRGLDHLKEIEYLKGINRNSPYATFLFIGIMLCDRNEYDKAIDFFNEVIANVEGDSKELSYLLLGKIYQYRKPDKEKAVACFRQAMRIAQLMPKAFYDNTIKKLSASD